MCHRRPTGRGCWLLWNLCSGYAVGNNLTHAHFRGTPRAQVQQARRHAWTFFYADVGKDEKIFIKVLVGFRIPGKVLKLKKTCYGLCYSPQAFSKYMVKKLGLCGLKQWSVSVMLMTWSFGRAMKVRFTKLQLNWGSWSQFRTGEQCHPFSLNPNGEW